MSPTKVINNDENTQIRKYTARHLPPPPAQPMAAPRCTSPRFTPPDWPSTSAKKCLSNYDYTCLNMYLTTCLDTRSHPTRVTAENASQQGVEIDTDSVFGATLLKPRQHPQCPRHDEERYCITTQESLPFLEV